MDYIIAGIKLKNNVIIIDEAHNLLEALADMYSAQITGHQVIHAHSQLTEYRNKYRTRFSAPNLLSINQLIFIVGKFIRILGKKIKICKKNRYLMFCVILKVVNLVALRKKL